MSIKITEELKTDFLVYANEVNTNRAFPDVRDGLKISQRAVLYEMWDKKYTSNKPHVKSAKVDGGVIANWHPHGSEYSTIVRMSQPWVNNIPEIDFHGANGSLIGGPDAAASRYTECRLSKASEDGFFNNINKEVVDYKLNYSEDEKWPTIFPAVFPRLFVNGSQGIGYTIAQEWEPNNLTEFYNKVKEYIETNKIDYSNIYPDYPTGGIIINKSEIENIYKTGLGKIILRGKAEIENNYINITELPYQVYAEPFIQEIKDLVNANKINNIEDICNKSDDNGLLISIECTDNPKSVLNKLYKLTDLQITLNANQMALVNGQPKLLNLKDYIEIYIEFNRDVLIRENKYDLTNAQNRLEIVEGLIKALENIDDIINIIKNAINADSAKKDLVRKYNFTENQVTAILNIKLSKLTHFEQRDLEKEKTDLNKIIKKCTDFISSKKSQNKEILKRLFDFTEKYSWKRKTQVIDLVEEEIEEEKEIEEYIVCLTENNYIKKIPINEYNENKQKDKIISKTIVYNNARLILISESGFMYKYDVNKLSACKNNSTGMVLPITEKFIAVYSGTEQKEFMLFVTSNGLIKKIKCKDIFNVSKLVGAIVMNVADEDKIVYSNLYNDDEQIILVNKKQHKKIIPINTLLAKGRPAGGIVGIKNFVYVECN